MNKKEIQKENELTEDEKSYIRIELRHKVNRLKYRSALPNYVKILERIINKLNKEIEEEDKQKKLI